MKFREYQDRDMLALDLANQIAGELGAALRQGGRVLFAVPGGTSPGPIFDVLSDVALDWSRVDVVLTDERWVPEDDPRSNTALVRKRLLTGKAAAASLLPLRADSDTPEEALDALSAGLKGHLPISVLLLGMGDDMHTASLFPGADRLADALASDAPVLMPMRAPGVPEPRITLTAPVLGGAMATHLLIFGPAKRAALQQAERLTPEEAPVSVVLDQATVHWCD